MNSRAFCIRTFGCKSNQYESQAIREILGAAGFREVSDLGEAAFLVLNSCGVTGRASASCRNAVRRALRRNPALRVVITGCGVDLGEKWPEECAPLLVPNAHKHRIPELLRGASMESAAVPREDGGRFAMGISFFHGHTRAFLKIQDGCDNYCAYCAVPLARGRPQSRAVVDIIEEATRLVENGYSELVLTGINIGVYRHGSLDFSDLVGMIARTPGLRRLRLGSVEPPEVTEKLVKTMRDEETICPHVHLPLQSGDDGVLLRMGRRYDAACFLEKVALLQRHLNNPAISTDVIVGFPGENGAAAERSAIVCRQAALSRLHVFLFSPRPGTPAASMPRTVPDREVEAWETRLIGLGDDLAEKYAASCLGMTERVIIEKDGTGLSDRYVRVHLRERDMPAGSVARVTVAAVNGKDLVGVAVE